MVPLETDEGGRRVASTSRFGPRSGEEGSDGCRYCYGIVLADYRDDALSVDREVGVQRMNNRRPEKFNNII
jgi:protein gp37